MIDMGGDMRLIQGLVCDECPTLPDMKQFVYRRFQPQLAPRHVVQLERGLGAKPFQCDLAGRCQQVRVKIARIAPREISRRMDG